MKMQRLRYKLRAAAKEGIGPIQYVRNTLELRKARRAAQRDIEIAKREIQTDRLQPGTIAHNEALLQATVEVFERYSPRRFDGTVTLFISDDPAYRGLSRSLDPRFRWMLFASTHDLRMFPGGHIDIVDDEDTSSFPDVLKTALRQAHQQAGEPIAAEE